jgi:hypothetical protein
MSEDLDTQIERKQAMLYPFTSSMEALKFGFTQQTIKFAQEWYRKTIKEYIIKYPETTITMKDEKITRMKNKVNELIQNTEKIAKTELDNPALWWHQRPRLHDALDQYLQVADKYPAIIDHAVRHILGNLGVILEEFRFRVAASGSAGQYIEFWFERLQGSEQIVPCYPHLLKWTQEMQETIQQYNSLYLQAMLIFAEIQEIKEQKKKQQALSRWDSI